MRYVINDEYGGFGVRQNWLEEHGLTQCDEEALRTNTALVEAIEAGENVAGRCAHLVVVDIPDEATDWELNEYDGCESIVYVLNGRLCHLYE